MKLTCQILTFGLFAVFFVLLSGLSAKGNEDSLDPFVHLSGAALGPEILKFSTTQTWDPKYLPYTQRTPLYLPNNWRSKIGASPPPNDTSKRTEAELQYLLQLQNKRTAEDEERIKSEITLKGFRFGKYLYPSFTDKQNRPKTAALAKAINYDIATVMFQAKLHYDRVRPHLLDKRIKPSIAVPGHPAYPSGHSTQAHAWAYILMELTPDEQHKSILAGAKQIAQDRELAGVHYPSDTALGQRIARQVVDMWLANPDFLLLLNGARQEW